MGAVPPAVLDGPGGAWGCAFAPSDTPGNFPATFQCVPRGPLVSSLCPSTLQWRPRKAPSTHGGEPSNTPVIARKLPDVPRLLPPQTPHSISACAQEAAVFPPNVLHVPKNVLTQGPKIPPSLQGFQ